MVISQQPYNNPPGQPPPQPNSVGPTSSMGQPQPFNNATPNAFTDPTGQRTFRPGMTLPTSAPGDVPIPNMQPQPDTATRQGFMPPELLAPFYNSAGVNANIGTMYAGLMPGLGQHIAGMMSQGPNVTEQNFMNTSAQDAAELMERMMGEQEGMFHNTPFHSALPQMQANVFDQFNRNLLNVGSSLALQRQQLANQAGGMLMSGMQQSLDYGPQIAERLFNLSNQAYLAPYQLASQTYAQLPFNAPTLVQTGGGGGGKGF